MKKQLLTLTGLSALLAAAPLMAHADILVNGGFENEPLYGISSANSTPYGGYTVMTGNAIPGWTIAPNTAATIHNTTVYPYITGNYSLNTDGEGSFGNNVNIYQDFASVFGQSYNLTFNWMSWVLGSQSKLEVKLFDTTTSGVLFDGIYSGTSPTLVPQNVSTAFAGTGDTLRLQIDENPQAGYNDNAYVVDDFSVVPKGNPSVPDATGWSAEIIAGLALVGVARKYRSVQA